MCTEKQNSSMALDAVKPIRRKKTGVNSALPLEKAGGNFLFIF